jgi:Uma2 family endonuclease
MISHALIDDLQITLPGYLDTLDGFRKWVGSGQFPQRGQVAYLDKEIFIDMSPERLESHNKPKSVINRVVGNLVEELDLGNLYQDRLWLTNDAAGLSTEPDGTFVSWQTAQSERIEIVAEGEEEDDGLEMRGSPDWVLEVVSKTSLRKDTEVLPDLYHRACVREYWLVDARGDRLKFDVFHFATGGYVAAEPSDGWLSSRVFQREFRLERSRDRIGRWRYRLHVREVPK